MAYILDLPVEVVEHSILSHLSWNDLLRCQRVCKSIKAVTDAYIRVNPGKAAEIEIGEENSDKNLKAFVELEIYTTKLFVKNPSGHEFFDNLDTVTLNHFVEHYGPIIKSLHLEQLSLCPCFNEWTFLTCLSSLKTLEARFLGYGTVGSTSYLKRAQRHVSRAKTDTRFNDLYFPESFNKTLEVIRIGNMHPMGCKYSSIHNRVPAILNDFEKLDYISFPVHLQYLKGQKAYLDSKFHQPRDVLVYMTTDLLNSIVTRSRQGQKHVNSIDFKNYYVNETFQVDYVNGLAAPTFLALCKAALQHDVELMNVQPDWLSTHSYQRDEVLRSADIGNSILSLINLEPCVVHLNMSKLEKIDIRETSRSAYDIHAEEGRPQWPNLKTLLINVDLRSEYLPEQEELHSLFDVFFRNIVRHQLTEIQLSFETKLGALAPKTDDIARSCPNLKILKISNWPGTNYALTKLWTGLPALEQLTLDNCAIVENLAFVGEDRGNPVFLKLKKLKKLILKGLDQMPKITDTLFSVVLARMKLTHLVLTSTKPLTKITRVGIIALSKGTEFASNIEKFAFNGWSLADLPAEEFQKLGEQFRSSQMI